MPRHSIAAFALGFVTLCGLACSGETYIGATCAETTDCRTTYNYGGGTVCDGGLCVCPNSGDEVCCPGGADRCPDTDFMCRPKAECSPDAAASSTAAASSGASSSSGSGGMGMVDECKTDEQCPGPLDAACGSGRCIEGKCELEIRAGQAVESQFPGDCALTMCSLTGELIDWMDPGDVPLDGNPCTFDACNAGKPFNEPFPDKTPCPGEDVGICVSGVCKDCSQLLDITDCPGDLVCDWNKCVPKTCNNDQKDGDESEKDCGGPSCNRCEVGDTCILGDDCASGVCDVDTGTCAKSTHSDLIKNDSETGIDCGYPGGPPQGCNDGEGCGNSTDCKSQVCYLGICQAPTCKDAIQNGSETGKDCGGTCAACPK